MVYGVTPAVQCGNAGPRLEMENVTEYNWTDIPEYNVAILVSERVNICVSVN